MDTQSQCIGSQVSPLCETLYHLLTPGFGPNGLKTLMTDSTGNILITNSGIRILKSLSLANPIGRMIVSAVMSMHEQTGDYSKTFIILLSSFLRKTKSYINILSCQSEYVSNHICIRRSISHFRRYILPELLIPKMLFKFSATSICHENVDVVLNVLTNLMKTCLGSRHYIVTANHLSLILANLIKSCCEDITNLKYVVQCLIDSFDLVCIQVVGEHPTSSYILDGVLICRKFLFQAQTLSCSHEVNFIIIHESFGLDNESDESAVLKVCNEKDLGQALSWRVTFFSHLIDHLQKCSISLILSMSRINGQMNTLCSSIGISLVQFVPEEDCHRISEIAKIHAICTVSDLEELWTEKHIGRVKLCKGIVIDGQHYVHMKGFESALGSFQKQLIVCGPSPGVCQEIKYDLFSALKAVFMWLSCDFLDSYATTSDSGSEIKKPQCNEERLVAWSLPSGGTFEMLLYSLLCEILRPDARHCLNESEKFICKIIQEVVLEVPLSLLRNSYKQSSCSAASLRHHISSVFASHGSCFGLDGRTGLPLLNDTALTEPVNSKIYVLSTVLEVLERILSIDMCVPIKKC